ncbi:hypothetical protein N7493_000951 [Penicillium malachiteum]|uniref:Uncharacterized protein n=1 Tax=Penicillium malachiteum TaxID=1324776 RepID=A0AAD6HXA1_9EURO|nr:hypothetical protein N7493_000951 [Penicillium malachiteum]
MADGAQKARDSLASILSYYQKHVPAEEHPEFVKRISSDEIPIGILKGDIPSEEQGPELQKAIDEALKTQDGIDKLSDAEKSVMTAAAKTSFRRRQAHWDR